MTAQHSAPETIDARLPQIGDVVADKYRVEGFIARGGMGAVLAATHEITGRRLALKWVLPSAEHDAEATHRIVREARAAGRVRHPNVVDVYDVGEHGGSLFLVMELLEGETLHARLKAAGTLDVRTTLTLLMPVLRAVETAHESHVIHRDLKPSNIFLCREPGVLEPTPRVLDFGISKILSSAGDGERSLTRTGAVLGTPQFMAPEQLTSDEADARTDVYALGVILYRCLTGRLPFQDSNYNALVLQIATSTPTPVAQLAPHVPAALSAIVMRAMAREPAARFQRVAELRAALQPFGTNPASGRAPVASASRSKLWWMALAVLAAAAVAAWAMQSPPAIDAAPSSVNAEPSARVPAVEAPAPAPAATVVVEQTTPVAPSAAAAAPAAALEPPAEPVQQRARARKRAPAHRVHESADSAPSRASTSGPQPVKITPEQF